MQNNTFDIYSQMNFLNPGMLGSKEFFKEQFAVPIDKYQEVESKAHLKKLIYPFLLRRTKEQVAKDLNLPLITGKTKHAERQRLYADFRSGKSRVLVVSKVANFAVDLPDATVMIQISGTYGSRQEEAQRLGRILRPNKKRSHFYTLVSKGTTEQQFGLNRQLFLVEQGYKYRIQYFD